MTKEEREEVNALDFDSIQRHKTLSTGQFTFKPPKKCVILDGSDYKDENGRRKKRPLITSTQGLFSYYKPETTIRFEKDLPEESFQFNSLEEFSPGGENGFIQKSTTLSNIQTQIDTLNSFIQNFEDDDLLEMLNDDDARGYLVEGIDLLTQLID